MKNATNLGPVVSTRLLTKARLSAAAAVALATLPGFMPVAHAANIVFDNSAATGEIGTAANWVGDVLPNVATGDVAVFDGTVAGPLTLTYTTGLGGAAGNAGITLNLASTQTANVSLDSGASTTSLRIGGVLTSNVGQAILINSGAGAFTLGDGAGTFNITMGGAGGTTQVLTNNSANTATINSDVVFGLGGGSTHTFLFNGTGNWQTNNIFTNGTGTLSLSKNDAGTLVLAGANTYSGGTTLTAGTIQLSGNGTTGANTGAVTVNGGTLDLNGLTRTVGALAGTGGTVVSNNAAATTFTIGNGNGSGAYAGVIANTNNASVGVLSLTKAGGGTQTLTGTNTYTGTTTVLGGALVANDGTSLPTASPLFLNGGSLSTSGTFTRALGTGPGQVTVAGLGGFTAVGGDLVVAIGGTGAPTPLTVGAGGFAPTTFFLNNGSATGTLDFRNNIDLAGATTFGVNVTNGTAATSATLSGNLTDSVGTGSFTKSGVGLLTLTGTNTYAGTTAINGGTLRANGASLSNANINFNGGVLGTSGTFNRTLGTGAGQVQWTGAGTALGGFSAEGGDLSVTLNNDAVTPLVWGTTTGFNPGSIVIGGPFATGTTTLTNNIDLSIPTTATVRTLLTQAGTGIVSGVISNTGAAQGTLVIEGNGTATGTLIFSNANSYGGTTQIDTGGQGAATVRATNSLAFGTSTILFNPGGNASTARLELANNINLANNITFTGRGNTTAGIESVSGNNTLSGTVSVTSGGSVWTVQSDAGSTLTLSGAAPTASAAGVAVTSVATGIRAITLQGDGNGVVSGLIQNGTATTFNVNKAGTGTWTLTKANTYNGATAITAGTLQLGDGTTGNDGTIASTSGIAVSSGATLAYNRFGTVSSDRVITGAGGVSKLGVGTQTLTGANTYTGTTTVQAGTLTLTNPAQAPVLAGAGGADVQGGKLVLDYTGGSSPVAQVKSILDAGYPSGFATGQIRSTVRPANTTLGYGDNGTAVTIRVTLPGDAELDGDVDFNDFLVLQNNFAQANTRFDQANFNYDGFTDFNDFLVLQNFFGQSVGGDVVAFTDAQVAALTAFAANPANQAVPEPASLALLGLGGLFLTRRRLRSQVKCDKM